MNKQITIFGFVVLSSAIILSGIFFLWSQPKESLESNVKIASPWENGLKPKIPDSPQLLKMGKQVYQTNCFICHGRTGDGQGSASRLMQTKPRSFTSGKFKIRTTPWGTLPTNEDLFRTISMGFPQYGMPSFKHLSEKERWAVVYFIKEMMLQSGRKQGSPAEIGSEPPLTPTSIARGKALYQKFGCVACHGDTGKADGPLARYFPKYFEGEDGTKSPPLDFTRGNLYFKSGGTPRDIVRTLITGFEGTRMVSYLPVLEDPMDLTPFWDLAHYIYKLSEREDIEP